MATVRVAAVQGVSALGDIAANVRRFSNLCREASENGAKIIVLPEAAITGYMSEDLCKSWHVPGRPLRKSQVSGQQFEAVDPMEFAEPVPGPVTNEFCALAKEIGCYITIPFVEKGEINGNTSFFNTVCLASPQGSIVAHYRKNNPWPYVDNAWMTAGRDTAVAETPYGRVGLAVCFDVHVMFERYKSDNLWALLYSIAWVDSNTPTWFGRHLPERVADANFHVVAANWSVPRDVATMWRDAGVDGYGHSSIYLSSGFRLDVAAQHTGDAVVYADLPTSQEGAVSSDVDMGVPAELPVFVGRWRSDFYGPTEEQEIRITGTGLEAVKVTGDLNVPAGMVTWYTETFPEVGGAAVDAWFQHRHDPSDPNGFSWERSSLKACSHTELRLKLQEGGYLRGSTGKYVRIVDAC